MKKLVTLLVMFSFGICMAQSNRTLKFNKETNLIEVTYHHENGVVSQTGFYTKKGKLHGEWKRFCKEGNKIVSAKYDNGKKVGKWFYWNDSSLKEIDYSKNVIANITEWTTKKTIASN